MKSASGLVFLFALVVLMGCLGRIERSDDRNDRVDQTIEDNKQISLVSWNLGYGGLGAGSDFFKDLGEQTRPPSPQAVDASVSGIKAAIGDMDADIFLFQEMARPSYVNYRRDLFREVAGVLPHHDATYVADFRTWLVPPPWSISIGNASFAPPNATVDRILLRGHTERYFVVASRAYSVHRIRFGKSVPWTIFNLHLSAFDAEDQGKRERQAREVLTLALAEYQQGRCVVLGGDWNMRLIPTNFPHSTADRFQFWIRDIILDLLSDGWHWAVDNSIATVRTLHKPYIRGENYITIVDGWALSPNVRVLDVETLNLEFAYSDHNPVRLRAECEL